MVHILGAGIAGLTLADALDDRGVPWCIYEKAAAPGFEASGKNAGIVRTYEVDPVVRHFAELSLSYYRRAEPSYKETGLILRPWDVDYAEKTAGQREFSHRRFSGLFLPQNGTLEPLPLLQRLAGRDFLHGTVEYGFDCLVQTEEKRILGLADQQSARAVALTDGDVLVAACGEGAVALAEKLGTPLGLIAHRRTLYEFQNTIAAGPVEWDEESGVYFRYSSDGATITATAGEQIPTARASGEIAADDEKLLQVLAREFPFLAPGKLIAQRTCKRLTPLDNRPYAGRDPVYSNLLWFTGLGGRGISTAPAIAEALAQMLCGDESASQLLEKFFPSRVRS